MFPVISGHISLAKANTGNIELYVSRYFGFVLSTVNKCIRSFISQPLFMLASSRD